MSLTDARRLCWGNSSSGIIHRLRDLWDPRVTSSRLNRGGAMRRVSRIRDFRALTGVPLTGFLRTALVLKWGLQL